MMGNKIKNEIPLVSVICSCYNHSKYVTEALDSVINQSYKNIQLIIIDDFSKDNSVETIQQWLTKNKGVLFIKNKTNLGITKSFNNSFTNVKGKYFMDLAADDILLKDCIEKLVDSFNQFSETNIGMVYGNVNVFNEKQNYKYYDKWPLKKKTLTPNDGFIYNEILNHANTVCSVSALIKTDIYNKLGGYDPNLMYEDYDFWLRVSRQYLIIYVDNVLAKKREVLSSLGGSTVKKFNKKSFDFNKTTYQIIKKTYDMNKNKNEDLASIKKMAIEIERCIRSINPILFLKYIILFLKFKFRRKFIK